MLKLSNNVILLHDTNEHASNVFSEYISIRKKKIIILRRAWLRNIVYSCYKAILIIPTVTSRLLLRNVCNTYNHIADTLDSMYTNKHITYSSSCIARDYMFITHTYSLLTPGIYSHIISTYTYQHIRKIYTDRRSEILMSHVRKIAYHVKKLRKKDVFIEPPYRIRFFIMNEQTTFPFNGCRGKRYT
jgi:hypothetical protein